MVISFSALFILNICKFLTCTLELKMFAPLWYHVTQKHNIQKSFITPTNISSNTVKFNKNKHVQIPINPSYRFLQSKSSVLSLFWAVNSCITEIAQNQSSLSDSPTTIYFVLRFVTQWYLFEQFIRNVFFEMWLSFLLLNRTRFNFNKDIFILYF